MAKQIIITENSFTLLTEAILLESSIFEASSIDEIKSILKRMIAKGFIISAALIGSIVAYYNLTQEEAKDIVQTVKNEQKAITNNDTTNKKENIKSSSPWKLAASDVIATVYNAVPSQCNNDFGTTASMFRLNLHDVSSHRIIAMERTFMKELGLKYGDVVRIEGTGKYDGEYQIQDTMNKRFAGMHKIDILVPDNVRLGKWNNVKLYVLKDKNLSSKIKDKMAPSISKAESIKQMNQLRHKKK